MSTQYPLAVKAAELVPSIRERAEKVEEQRFISEESIQELQDAGLFRALQPKRWGGMEAHPADFSSAIIEIGKACTSTSWVLCVVAVHYWELSYMTDQAQEDVLGTDPSTLISSAYARTGTATKVDGGYLLNGRWRSSSGVVHAKWSIVGVAVEEEGQTRTYNFVIDLSEAQIIDDWYVMGLCGTGSRTIVVENMFVPEHRVIDREFLMARVGPGLKRNDGPLYQVGQGHIYSLVGGLPALGAAYAFLDEFRKQSKAYSWRGEAASMAEHRPALLAWARGHSAVATQEKLVLDHLETAYDLAAKGVDFEPRDLARDIYDIAKTAQVALDVPQSLFTYLSAGVAYKHNPLQRLYRDIITARQHNTQNVDITGATLANIEFGNDATSLLMLTSERREAARQRAERVYG